MVEHAALEGQGGFRMQLWDKGTGGLLQRSSAGRCVGSAGGPGFHGRVAVKLMHRESRNGDEVIAKSGWCLLLFLCSYQAFVVELGEFVTGCHVNFCKVCQVGVDFEWLLCGQRLELVRRHNVQYRNGPLPGVFRSACCD